MMSLLPFWGFKVVVTLLIRDRKLSDFIKKIFIRVPKMYGFETI